MVVRGRRVVLRPAVPADRRRIYAWLTESDSARHMYGPPTFPENPAPTWEAFCSDYLPHFFDGSAPERGRCFVITAGGEDVGQINYNEVDRARRRTELDVWLRSEADCGKGLGSEAVGLLCDHLCRELDLVEFMMQPSARNPRAIRAYEKAGFRRIGLSPEAARAEWGPLDHADAVHLVRRLPARVRAAAPGDLPFLRAMLYEAVYWDPARLRPGLEAGLARPELAKLLRGFGERPGDAALVAHDEGGAAAGAAWLRLWTAGDHSYGFVDEATPELGVAVAPGQRGRGIGAQLLRALAIEAGRLGFERLSLSVERTNPARRLYERLGWREVGGVGGAATLVLELAR